MMNEKYKSAFSLVAPSDDSVERIFTMTEKKKINLKPLLLVAVISALLAASVITANATTDGAVLDAVQNFVGGEENASKEASCEFHIERIDGEDSKVVIDEDGEKYGVQFEERDNDCYVLAIFVPEECEANEIVPYTPSETEKEMVQDFLNDIKSSKETK